MSGPQHVGPVTRDAAPAAQGVELRYGARRTGGGAGERALEQVVRGRGLARNRPPNSSYKHDDETVR